MKALITGASSGIGLECARELADKGYDLILIARRLERLEKIKKELEQKVQVNCIKLDITKREDVVNSLSNLNDIDVLINNAGLALSKDDLVDMDLDDLDIMVDTNIKGLMYVTRIVLPEMVKKNKGDIIFMGSTAAIHGYKGGSAYCATKAAVRSISEALRIELIATDLRVTNIQPGIVETDFSLVRFKGDLEKSKSVYENIDALQAKDIAKTVSFIISCPLRVQVSEITIMANKQATGTMVHYVKNS